MDDMDDTTFVDAPPPAPDATPYRLFVLTTWRPHAGLAIDPVGVLGVAGAAGQPTMAEVAWLPYTWDTAATWQRRLAEATDADLDSHLLEWSTSPGTDDFVEVTSDINAGATNTGATRPDLRTAVQVVLEQLLTSGLTEGPAAAPPTGGA